VQLDELVKMKALGRYFSIKVWKFATLLKFSTVLVHQAGYPLVLHKIFKLN